ncbi:MAG: alanine racemase [Bacteroidia bacterium]|nr:alanine racemase [Bacteroidia bacterium]
MVALGRSWSPEELASLLDGQIAPSARELPITHIAWDTRLLLPGKNTLFIALRGQRDGHAYIEEAFQKGAVACLSERPLPDTLPHIRVHDTWEALWKWAATWRRRLSYPLLAITGSLGKTWVKEWLSYLLEGSLRVVRSPGSFNSRLGVPLSVLSFLPEADIGLVEVAITAPGEMPVQARLLQPEYGLLTRLSLTADTTFPSLQEKLKEHLRLFSQSRWIVALSSLEGFSLKTDCTGLVYEVGRFPQGDFQWEPEKNAWHLPDSPPLKVRLPSEGEAFWQNAFLAAAAAYLLGVPLTQLQERLQTLPPLPHRLQWLQDAYGRFWLNDTYHADYASTLAAIEELCRFPAAPKTVILTDFSPYTEEIHHKVVDVLKTHFSPDEVHLIGPIFSRIGWGHTYPDKATFLEKAHLSGRAFLLKGSRRFRMEEVLGDLTGYGPGPELYIDWEKVYRNLTRLRARLPQGVQILAMLKAEAYGSGDRLMASFLQRQGISYFGVAYTHEALRLREAGLTAPIIVFYPGQEPAALFQKNALEVAVSTWEALQYWAGKVPLHIEFDTGMGRMGFRPEELPEVLAYLHTHNADVKGVFSHLAAAEAPHHPLTQSQLEKFALIYKAFKETFPHSLGHLLNTAGVLSLAPHHAYDLVRIGIGLYGIGSDLEEATALYAPILRVQAVKAGQPLNYGFRSIPPSDGYVATIGIGYGDGLLRRWAEEGGYLLIGGQKAPILPPLNMDLTLVWLEAGQAKVGDKAEVWGPHRSLQKLAEEMHTSPYEVLVRLSHRVRRVYTWGQIA